MPDFTPLFVFLAEYYLGKGLDHITDQISQVSRGRITGEELHAVQLYQALDDALRKTCDYFSWEYDRDAIKRTLSSYGVSWADFSERHILEKILENAVGPETLERDKERYFNKWEQTFQHELTSHEELFHYLQMRSAKTGTGAGGTNPGLLRGRYSIIEQIGSGGYSRVYRAYDQNLNRYVAVKVFWQSVQQTLFEDKNGAVNENLVLNGTKSPGLPYIQDVFLLEDGKAAMVMDLIEGETLLEYVEGRGPFENEILLSAFRQICVYVRMLHEELRVIHGDLKPNNIMIDKDHNVFVIDFNLSRKKNRSGILAQPLGRTDGYSPPEFYTEEEWGAIIDWDITTVALPISREFLSSRNRMPQTEGAKRGPDAGSTSSTIVSVQSDIYSLGATLFFMMTGRHPWPPESVKGTLEKGKYNPLLSQIVVKCMRRDPKDRYKTAEEIIELIGGTP